MFSSQFNSGKVIWSYYLSNVSPDSEARVGDWVRNKGHWCLEKTTPSPCVFMTGQTRLLNTFVLGSLISLHCALFLSCYYLHLDLVDTVGWGLMPLQFQYKQAIIMSRMFQMCHIG